MSSQKFNPLLLKAFLERDIETFKKLLKEGEKGVVWMYQYNPYTIFTRAAENYDLEILEIMLANGTDVNENINGYTALRQVIGSQSPGDWRTIADFLIDNGANINILETPNKTCLYSASRFSFEREEKWRYLHGKGLDINHKNNNNDTILFCIAGLDHLKILVELGFDITQTDKNGETCIMRSLEYFKQSKFSSDDKIAFDKDYAHNIDFALKNGVNINQRNRWGETALSIARAKFEDNTPLIKFLIANGAI